MAEETFKERLVRFARERYDKGMNKFEDYCGISNGTINSITRGISTYTLKPIAEKCPELNLRWLITGEGDMCLDDESIERSKAVELKKEIELLKTEIQALRDTIDQQKIIINSLTMYAAHQKMENNGEDIHRG